MIEIEDQLELIDIFPNLIPPPPFPECQKTCAHFGGPKDDYFPLTHDRRCGYGMSIYGSSGEELFETIVNGRVLMHCKLYERKTKGRNDQH